MKIIVASDSFKGSLSALEAVEAITKGIRTVIPHSSIVSIPLADGGEGTVDAMIMGAGGSVKTVKVLDPLGRDISSFFGILKDGKTAVIEMAAASGLPLISEKERNPLITSTQGTGQLIKAALDAGCTDIIIGIGGSATNDGGAGMALALGVKFLDAKGKMLTPGGAALKNLARIDVSEIDSRIKNVKVTAACDVDNPLCGPTGASAIYGPQKGATPEMIKALDHALENYGNVIKKQLGIDVANTPGAGAAGGLGAGIMAFLQGHLKPGIDIVLETMRFEEHIKKADLVITGEGRIDGQTAYGKAPVGVAKKAKSYGVPVIALSGVLGDSYEKVYDEGIDYVGANIYRITSLQSAIRHAKCLLEENAERAMRAIAVGIALGKRDN